MYLRGALHGGSNQRRLPRMQERKARTWPPARANRRRRKPNVSVQYPALRGAINKECPVCGSENADLTKCEGKEVGEQVKAVQAQIDALPSLEDIQAMSPEDQQKAHEKVQAAYDAYNALTDEQKAQITGAEIFEACLLFSMG